MKKYLATLLCFAMLVTTSLWSVGFPGATVKADEDDSPAISEESEKDPPPRGRG